tara:strand:- start:46 stop:963 length:918 start_codon:yes stop_codon:yes gene_type:complete
MKSFLSFILFVAASASAEFETIIKDQVFKDSFNLEPDEKFVELEEGFTYYKTNISPECSEYYMLVHGFSVPSYILDPVYILLSEKSYCVIALDLYGRGFSENIDKPYTDRLFAEQTLQLLDHLDIEKATFLGLSNGGRVISMIANIKPESVNALIYVASSGFLENEEVVDKSVSQKEIDNIIAQYPSLIESQLSDFKYPEKYPDWIDKYAELTKYKGFAKALLSTRNNHTSLDDIHKRINQSNIPIFTIWGESDEVVPYDTFKNKLQNIFSRRNEFFVLESAHLPHMENPEQFNGYLLDILEKLN